MDGGEGCIWLGIGMIGREGDVIAGVPVFGCDFFGKGKGEKAIYGMKNVAAIGNC